MWGTLRTPKAYSTLRRFIPTCVGNTLSVDDTRKSHTVHPHVCGEHFDSYASRFAHCGSSPRVWGTQNDHSIFNYHKRFIPTCVGNTPPERPPEGCPSVHPHVCGEHMLDLDTTDPRFGSSPRVWGTRLQYGGGVSSIRFIPTCVGNTRMRTCRHVANTVHPHVCGEHVIVGRFNRQHNGSSPRVWGTQRPGHGQRRGERFIPTCVGNTEGADTNRRSDPVHPHVCGEHIAILNQFAICHGSSPRVWGTPHNGQTKVTIPRFIPTCVGNTSALAFSGMRAPVHPHVCGEHD